MLKDELRRLPSDLHRVAVEAVYGLWFEPTPRHIVAPALRLLPEELDQRLQTSVSLLREEKHEGVRRFRRAFDEPGWD